MIREDKILARVEILLIFVFFSLCREQTLSAGTGVSDYYLSSVIDVNDGLRNPNANGIFRDDKGFVWISTFGGGLERYDGESLVSFAPQENMLIRSAYLTNSVQDDHDRLWSAGIKGIDIIDLRTLSVVSPPGELAATYDGCYIPDVVRAEDGGIWYCARNFLYRVVMDGMGDSVEIDSLKCSDMDMNMRLILGDVNRDGSIWTSHNGQIIKIVHNTGGGLVMREAIPGLSIGETNKASCFLRSGDKVWIGTQTGLFCIDSTTGEVRIYHHDASDQNSLSNDEVTCIAATNDGEVVVGTLGGASIYDSSEDSLSIINQRPDMPAPKCCRVILCVLFVSSRIRFGWVSRGMVSPCYERKDFRFEMCRIGNPTLAPCPMRLCRQVLLTAEDIIGLGLRSMACAFLMRILVTGFSTLGIHRSIITPSLPLPRIAMAQCGCQWRTGI